MKGLRQCLILVLSLWLGMGVMGQPILAMAIPNQLQTLEQQVDDLQVLVDQQAWFDIGSYLGGPMGLVRKDLAFVVQTLPRSDRKPAQQLARQITDNMFELKQGAKQFDATAIRSAQKDLRQSVLAMEALVEAVDPT